MLFNSFEFLVFLIVVYTLYRFFRHSTQNLMLLIASYFFYGWWDVRFLFLIVISTCVDFCAGLMIDEGEIHRNEGQKVAFFALASAILFVFIQWSALERGTFSRLVWRSLFSSSLGWATLLGTFIAIGLGRLLYRYFYTRSEQSSGQFSSVNEKVKVSAFHDNRGASEQSNVSGSRSKRPAMWSEQKRRNWALYISLICNLGILAFFKYFNFFIGSAESIIQTVGFDPSNFRLNIILPVGISFYTFQTMSYTIDIYRGKLKATRRFFDFALFVSYFPQLVAGPIERASHLLPCILKPRKLTAAQSFHGLHLILVGLFKKVAIADGVARTVDQVFSSTGAISSVEIVVGTIFFAIQIYCDFSGYSDIARGVSNLLGIELMINFQTPYFAKNPREFWQRWHISLSTWLRDYLYIPLGGNRASSVATYRNLIMTMTLGGLWHGAAWNFVLWGIYQGLILCLHRFWALKQSASQAAKGLRNAIGIVLFQPFILYGWLLFRAQSFQQISDFTGSLLWPSSFTFGLDLPRLSALAGIPILIGLDSIEYFQGNDEKYYQRLMHPVRGFFYAAMIFCLLIGLSNASAQFIYFDF